VQIISTLRRAADELRVYANQHDGTLARQHARALATALEAEARVIEHELDGHLYAEVRV